MAAMPLGMVVGAFLIVARGAVGPDPDDGLARHPVLRADDRQRLESAAVCRPGAVGAGRAGGAYQLAAAAFVQALTPDTRARAFGLAQSGLYAVQGLGIVAGGAAAQAVGPRSQSAWLAWSG